jgi:hypothetical protein
LRQQQGKLHASFETNLVTLSCLSHLFSCSLASATIF